MSPLLLVVVFLAFVIIGLPIAFSFGVTSLIYLMTNLPGMESIIVSRTFGSMDSFPLMAIPFFIFAGDIMKHGGISRSLVGLVNLFVGKIRGALAHVTIVACTIFGAISGSAAATVAAIGGIMIPEMVKRGYDERFAVVVSASSGFIGILIPPSIPLIVYGMNAQVSVGWLFLGGVVPGLMMAASFMIVSWFLYPHYKKEVAVDLQVDIGADIFKSSSGKVKTIFRATPALFMPFIILGGIYSGVFTPTESGAVAVVYGILVALLYYKELTLKSLFKNSAASAVTSGMILIIIGMAGTLGWVLTTENVPQQLADAVLSITQSPYMVLLLLNIIFLILGIFMETVTAIVITTPIFLPLITALGIDLIHFGVVQTVNLAIGLITPPMALNLLIASNVGGIKLMTTIKPLVPYFISALIVLIIVTYIPQTVLFLPNLLLK